MRIFGFERYGGPEVQQFFEVPPPERRDGTVLVAMRAAGVNPADLKVRNGQRRTVAACKVGLTTVPVYVLAATAADTAAETIDRVVHQIVTSDQKRDLSDAQRARGIQQMIDAGLSVTKVAKIHRLKYARCIVARPPVSAEVLIPAGASC